jgi:hypothetical protein
MVAVVPITRKSAITLHASAKSSLSSAVAKQSRAERNSFHLVGLGQPYGTAYWPVHYIIVRNDFWHCVIIRDLLRHHLAERLRAASGTRVKADGTPHGSTPDQNLLASKSHPCLRHHRGAWLNYRHHFRSDARNHLRDKSALGWGGRAWRRRRAIVPAFSGTGKP